MINSLQEIEVLTLFVSDLDKAKSFYSEIFGLPVVFEDDVSSVMKFGSVMINLLDSSQAPELVKPKPVAPSNSAANALLTIKVADVNAVCRELQDHGVTFLNGPTDQAWGRRTAAFEDPDGNVWEIAEEI